MPTTKERYWKYSLIILILFFGLTIFFELWSFFNGLLGAFTIYTLVRGQMAWLQTKMKAPLAAILILLEVILCLLVPTFLFFWAAMGKIQHINLDLTPMIQMCQSIITTIQDRTGYNILSTDNLTTITGVASRAIQFLIGQISGIVINSIVLIFLLYFMLISNRRMEDYLYDLLPFNDENKKSVMNEVKMMVRSNAIGIPLLAVIQGGIAVIGYLIFGVPSPFLFGFLTCFATIIPLVGTGLVWFPICVYFAIVGNWFGAIGLAAYSLIILTNIDNVIRLVVQKRLADIHPLITVFGVILGLSLFGFWGIIFGPLLLSMFFLLIGIFKKEYLDTPGS